MSDLASPNTEESAAMTPDWQPLPPRARPLFALGIATPLVLPFAAGGFFLARWLEAPPLLGAGAAAALAFGFGLGLGLRQFRHVAWRLDRDGLAIRRGRLWQRETRVPATRVQHLDLRRGPWQRRRGLATVVAHTAGTRHSAITVPHLDAADAEHLRDVLGRQVDHDDD